MCECVFNVACVDVYLVKNCYMLSSMTYCVVTLSFECIHCVSFTVNHWKCVDFSLDYTRCYLQLSTYV